MRHLNTNFDQLIKHRKAQHILFWLVVIFYFTIGYGSPGRYGDTFQRVILFLPGHIFLTYVFFYYLIPKFLVPKKIFYFIVLGVFTYFLSLYYAYNVNFHLLPIFNLQSIWVGSPLIGQTTMLGAALSIKFLKQWYKEKQNANELKQQKMEAELNLLKAQIHPHFLFNTLNNLYSHILEKSPQAPEIVLKLSELLRFMVYESLANQISLSKEITLIEEYIDLEQLRYGDRLDMSVQFDGDIENKAISPLIFLPLIENAFKHGVSNQLDQCWISLHMHIEGDELDFKLINSKDPESMMAPAHIGGKGIENVKKRLNLVYPGKHHLEIINQHEVFIVSLQLTLESSDYNELSKSIYINPVENDQDKLLTRG
jgi:sensor histidine kinase YesM